MKQLRFKLSELRLCLKFWFSIPKGVRRNLIELTIALGELSSIQTKGIKCNGTDKVEDIAVERVEYIKSYIRYLKGGSHA